MPLTGWFLLQKPFLYMSPVHFLAPGCELLLLPRAGSRKLSRGGAGAAQVLFKCLTPEPNEGRMGSFCLGLSNWALVLSCTNRAENLKYPSSEICHNLFLCLLDFFGINHDLWAISSSRKEESKWGGRWGFLEVEAVLLSATAQLQASLQSSFCMSGLLLRK